MAPTTNPLLEEQADLNKAWKAIKDAMRLLQEAEVHLLLKGAGRESRISNLSDYSRSRRRRS